MTAPETKAETIANCVVETVRKMFPINIEDEDASPAFSLAGLARMVDLLDAELHLIASGRWAVARIFGRALREVWLITIYLCLAPDEALELLEKTDARHHEGIRKGVEVSNEILRKAGIGELPEWKSGREPKASSRFDLAKIARRVDSLVTARGAREGAANLNFELFYRRESGEDVHPSNYDFFFRYMEPSPSVIKVLASPKLDGYISSSPFEELRSDALAVADAVRYVAQHAGQPSLFINLAACFEEKAKLKLVPLHPGGPGS